jgi:hypothetical protein
VEAVVSLIAVGCNRVVVLMDLNHTRHCKSIFLLGEVVLLGHALETASTPFRVDLQNKHVPEDGAETKDQGHAPLHKVHRSTSNDSATELDQKDLEQNGEEHDAEEPLVVVSPVEHASSLWFVLDPSV